jgi:hypothetical protein
MLLTIISTVCYGSTYTSCLTEKLIKLKIARIYGMQHELFKYVHMARWLNQAS